jgi:hypothetical protein
MSDVPKTPPLEGMSDEQKLRVIRVKWDAVIAATRQAAITLSADEAPEEVKHEAIRRGIVAQQELNEILYGIFGPVVS